MVLKINFVDFPFDFNREQNFFLELLKTKYEVELSDSPEILFYGNYGQEYLKYNCLKVFYSSENVRPDFRFCDFSFSFDYDSNPKNFRLPLFVLHAKLEELTQNKDLNQVKSNKNRFCNFVYSNPKATERNHFFELLNAYKKVDSPGQVFNNMPNIFAGKRYDYKTKIEFLNHYKFTLAFENESYPGYTTEKILHPMQVNSIPIYFGNPRIEEDFNTASFINVHDFATFQEAIDFIIKVDNDDELYKEILRQPYFIHNKVPYQFSREYYLSLMEHILGQRKKIKPVSITFKGRYRIMREKLRLKVKTLKRK
nr:glycosyltransferase [Cytophagales bacterium]